RAEGVAAIDPAGALAVQRFPTGGTLGHAALLSIAALHERQGASCGWEEIVRVVGDLAERHRRRWANDLVDSPARLAGRVVELLVDLRLAEWVGPTAGGEDGDEDEDGDERTVLRLLPA